MSQLQPEHSPAARVEHLRPLHAQSSADWTVNGICLLLLGLIFWPLAPAPQVLGWLALGGILWSLRLAHDLRFRRQAQAGAAQRDGAWHGTWTWLVLAQGSLWPAAVWLFWDLGTPYHPLALILVACACCLGSVQWLAKQKAVFAAFLAVVLGPTILRVASDSQQPWHLQLAGILLLLTGLIWWLGRTQAQVIADAARLQLRAEERAQEQQQAAEASEKARRAAEAANLAKTQFFAAASHDLRQPLHAMGLFAEALRQRCSDQPEVARLAGQIHASVDMLEGMFGELMDLTRIDSGSVACNLCAVPLRQLFARLRLQFEPLAFDKGLMFSLRGERHVVHADPVLLERILSNLVGNAIRYTEDGGVLVSCRPRAGKLRVQVWDSGIGIPADSLPRVFDEFYQVRVPAADASRPAPQHKGFGLGLAIVKRMAVLMDAPLSVQSQPGRGTVFSLDLVPARQHAPAPEDF